MVDTLRGFDYHHSNHYGEYSNMKMTEEDFATLTEELDVQIEKLGIETLKSHFKKISEDSRVYDVAKRLRWDIFWLTEKNRIKRGGSRLTASYYEYLTDAHIDSALKTYVRKNPIFKIIMEVK